MANSERRKPPAGLPLVLALAIISGAVVLIRLPLQTSRPTPPEGLVWPTAAGGKIGARLWQDPLKVVLDHERDLDDEAEQAAQGSGSEEHSVERLRQRIAKLCKDPSQPPPGRPALNGDYPQ